MNSKNKRLIVVLGMHRSGTSAITRGLQVMGVELGNRLNPPDPGNNDKGFFEDLDILDLNIQMLHAINTDWHFLAPLEALDVEKLCNMGFFQRASELLQAKTAFSPIFGIKDPRLAKLIPFWNRVFVNCGFDTGYILAIRNPLSVAQSLAKRDGFSPEKSFSLCLGHLLSILINTEKNKRIIVDYDQFLYSPQQCIELIANCLGLEINKSELQVYLNDFIDNKLRHSHYSVDDLAKNRACPELLFELYSELQNIILNNGEIDNVLFYSQVSKWSNEFDRIRSYLKWSDNVSTQLESMNLSICRLEDQLIDQKHILVQKYEEINNLNSVLAHRDDQVGNLTHTIAELDEQIGNISFALVELDKRVGSLCKAVVDKDEAINNLQQIVLDEKEKLTCITEMHAEREFELNSQLNKKQCELEYIHSTFVWRWTTPFRNFASLLFGNTRSSFEAMIVKAPERSKPVNVDRQRDVLNLSENNQNNNRIHNMPEHYICTASQSLDELLSYQDQQFIQAAYLTLLDREPDPEGQAYYLYRIRTGVPKLQVLDQMLNSSEAKRLKVVLPGLENAVRVFRNTQIPLVGCLFRLFVKPSLLQAVSPLEEMLKKQSIQFVENAYQLILKRQVDPVGLKYYVERLQNGVPKIEIIGQIVSSPESKAIRASIPQLRFALMLYRFSRWPLLGNIIKLFADIEGNTINERRLRTIEQHFFQTDQNIAIHLDSVEQKIYTLQHHMLKNISQSSQTSVKHPQSLVNKPPVMQDLKVHSATNHSFDVVFAIGCWEGESKRYRVYNIAEGLAKFGYKVQVMPFEHIATLADQNITAGVVVLFRAPFDVNKRITVFLEFAKQNGIRVVFDVDDLIFDLDIIDQIDGYKFLASQEKKQYVAGVEAYRKLLLASDIVTVPTEYLCDRVTGLGKPTFVIPNSINDAQLAEAAVLSAQKKNDNGNIRIGYFSGSHTHQADFAECADALFDLMITNRAIVLRIVGFLDLDARWDTLLNRIERFEFQPYLTMLQLLHECDINIAPLQLSSVFCHGKSELKFFEAALLGIPTIASATDTYSRVITNGINGFCAASDNEWRKAFDALVSSPELRLAMGLKAKDDAIAQFAINQVAITAAQIYGLNPPLNTTTPACSGHSLTTVSECLQISWVIPDLIIGGGGHRNILRAAYFLSKFGHKISLYFTGTKETPQSLKNQIQQHFYPLDCPVYVFNGTINPADVVFATHWSTVTAALTAQGVAREIMYFVQDFEPLFAPMSTEYVLAENTYRLGLYHITSGPWCEAVLRRDFNAEADHFRFPIDRSIYYPRYRSKLNKNIIFFAKPEMPRRCFELGIMALESFHRIRPDVEIILFGSKNAGKKTYNFPVTVRDLVPTLYDLAEMYANGDLGLVFSTTNPSLIPYEMMACGLPIVDLDRNDNSVNYGGRDDIAFLADPLPEKMAMQIAKLFDSTEELAQRRANGLEFVNLFPSEEEMARRIETLIIQRLKSKPLDRQICGQGVVCPSCESIAGYDSFDNSKVVRCTFCSSIVNLAELVASKDMQLPRQSDSSVSFYRVDEALLKNIPDEIEKRLPTIHFLFEKYPDVPRGMFVDFGAGYGFVALAAQPYFERVCAVEVNRETIGKVLTSSDTGMTIDVYSSIDDITELIDVCFMWHVVEHIPNAVQLLRIISNKLSSGGCIFAQVPMYQEKHVCKTHYHFLNEDSVKIMCERAGLTKIETYIDYERQFLTFIAKKSK